MNVKLGGSVCRWSHGARLGHNSPQLERKKSARILFGPCSESVCCSIHMNLMARGSMAGFLALVLAYYVFLSLPAAISGRRPPIDYMLIIAQHHCSHRDMHLYSSALIS